MRLLLFKRIKQFLKRRFQMIKFQIQNPSINLSADGWIMSNTIRQDGGQFHSDRSRGISQKLHDKYQWQQQQVAYTYRN